MYRAISTSLWKRFTTSSEQNLDSSGWIRRASRAPLQTIESRLTNSQFRGQLFFEVAAEKIATCRSISELPHFGHLISLVSNSDMWRS